MITYEMIEKKIDKLIKEGHRVAQVTSWLVTNSFKLQDLYISEGDIFVDKTWLNEYMEEFDKEKHLFLYYKLKGLFEKQQDVGYPEEYYIINYLEN